MGKKHFTEEQIAFAVLPASTGTPVARHLRCRDRPRRGLRADRGHGWEERVARPSLAAGRAAVVVTVSRFTADDVERHLDLRGRPLHVVPNGMALAVVAAAARPRFLPEGPFLLTVGNVLPHKNVHVLVGLMERLPGQRLVIAGKRRPRMGRRSSARSPGAVWAAECSCPGRCRTATGSGSTSTARPSCFRRWPRDSVSP